MTEAEWLNSTDPLPMLEFLRGKASDRKFRLYAAADCRRVWSWFADDEASRHLIEGVEQFADGQAGTTEVAAAQQTIINSGRYSVAVFAADSDAGSSAWAVAHIILESVIQCESDKVETIARAEKALQCPLVHDIFGNPFHPLPPKSGTRKWKNELAAWLAWNGGTLPKLAQGIYYDRAFDRLPVLADALEDAGCHAADILGHCRGPGPHVRGCWVVDAILVKS
jgi:hypothetical protein